MERLFNLIRRNFWYKISAVFFAILMWSLIMAEANPPREQTFTNISVSPGEYEEVMQLRGLKIREDFETVFQPVMITFNGPLNELKELNENELSVTPDFSKVSAASESFRIYYKLASYAGGLSASISPAYVDVKLESVTSREVPVDIAWEGELNPGYFMGEPEFENKTITLNGAVTDVERVTKALCTIDKTTLTKTTKGSYTVQLYGENGQVISPKVFDGEIPSVIVSINVFPQKAVPIDLSEAFIGENKIKEGFEIEKKEAKPNTVTIYGDKDILDKIRSIKTEKWDISGESETIYQELQLLPPEGVTIVGSDTVEVFVEINEERTSKIFDNVPVSVTGAGEAKYSLSADTVSLTVSGKLRVIRDLKLSDLTVFVDISKISGSPGVHTLNVECDHLVAGLLREDIVSDPLKITVTIR